MAQKIKELESEVPKVTTSNKISTALQTYGKEKENLS